MHGLAMLATYKDMSRREKNPPTRVEAVKVRQVQQLRKGGDSSPLPVGYRCVSATTHQYSFIYFLVIVTELSKARSHVPHKASAFYIGAVTTRNAIVHMEPVS